MIILKVIVLLQQLTHRSVSITVIVISIAINASLVIVLFSQTSSLHLLRELSYNQIEDLPSFYHCSSLQEM